MNNCYSSSSNNFISGLTDQQITYTGNNISIGVSSICQGDSLSVVESFILQTLVNYSTGVGITIPNINLTTGSCAALFTGCISCCNQCTDLNCLLSCYYSAFCNLYSDVTTLQNESLTGPFNTACLQNVTSASTSGAIFQEIILELCTAESNITALQTSFTNLNNSISTTVGNFLLNAITTCSGTGNITKTGTGSTASIQFQGFVPVGGVIIYVGSLANFGSGGLGITGTPMCGWAIADGRNGTINMMGQVPVGLTSTGGSLPTNASGLAVGVIGASGGEVKHTLVSAEIPSTSVNITDNHTHNITGVSDAKSGGNNNVWVLDLATVVPGTATPEPLTPPYNIPNTFSGKISTPVGATATGSVAGGGGSHNNMQPYTGVVYIQRLS